MCGVVWCYTGPIEQAEATFKPIREKFPPAWTSSVLSRTRRCRVCSMRCTHHDCSGIGNGLVNELSDEAIERYIQHGSACNDAVNDAPLSSERSGAPREQARHGVELREATWAEVIVGVDPDPANKDLIVTWARQY